MKSKYQVFLILLILFATIFSGCDSKKQTVREFTVDDAKSVYFNNRQAFNNVQKAFKTSDISHDGDLYGKNTYNNQNMKEEQRKALDEIFSISEVYLVYFCCYSDPGDKELKCCMKFHIKKKGYIGIFQITSNPTNSHNIIKTSPETILEDKWFIFISKY